MTVTYVGRRYPAVYGHGEDAFDPSSISGLQVWLDASQITGLADNDLVAIWEDNSGANHDATQGNSGLQPTYKTAALNGLPVVRFDGTDNFLELGNLSASFPSAATLFVAATLNDTIYVLYDTDAGLDAYYSFTGAGYWGTFTASRRDNYPAVVPTAGSHIFSLVSSASTYQVSFDGVAEPAQAAGYLAGTLHRIGCNGQDHAFLAGDIAEVLVYNTALSAGDKTAVEDYLIDKWGL
jgi:hypothetical protein